MARLIDADEAILQIEKREKILVGDKAVSVEAIKEFINNRPIIDPVKHGKWLKLDGEWKNSGTGELIYVHQCSVCGGVYMYAPYRYCPSCGARMDKEE